MQVKTGTSETTGVYDSANYQDESQPKEGTPVYDTADHRDSSQPPISKGSTPQESYSRLCQPTETSITLQPVPPTPLEAYDTPTFTDKMEQPVYEDLPPVSEKTRHPSKSPASYEEIDEDLNLYGGSAPPGVYDKAYPTPSGDVDPSVLMLTLSWKNLLMSTPLLMDLLTRTQLLKGLQRITLN